MITTADIRAKIESDFGEKASEVFQIFEDAFLSADYLNHDRIIRCILFLSDKDIEKLKKNIATATFDPRDVMLWAEYKNQGQDENPKRVRDFNKSFDRADQEVKE